MWILLISIIVLGIVAAIFGKIRYNSLYKKLEKGEIAEIPEAAEVEEECCGDHQICEKDSLLAAVSKNIDYYDDEELDTYIGTHSDHYSTEQVEEFRNIFYTLQETDVAGWVRSLQLRGIDLPDQLKDEVVMVIGERRIHN